MDLRTLAARLSGSQLHGELPDVAARVHYDWRQLQPGDLFVAVRDLWEDGHAFLGEARAAGATLVAERAPQGGGAWLEVRDGAEALAHAAALAAGEPAERLRVCAVTGTNGKTTVAWLLYQILAHAGRVPGLIGTVEQRFGDEVRSTQFTTPLSLDLQNLLAEMDRAGCTDVALEASSHALTTHRLTGTRVAVAGFTNLSRDHLDFHGGWDGYREAKRRLFTDFAQAACFHVDDPVGAAFAEGFDGQRLTVGRGAGADLVATESRFDLSGARCTLRTSRGGLPLRVPLVGEFNLENALVALGMAALAGVELDVGAAALASCTPAAGRLEFVSGPEASVFVDYAHTPDAVRRVLETLRPMTPGRLVVVFGAGGDRDRGKRPLMGTAASLADYVVVTSDNPRTEAPEAIIADIVPGVTASHHVEVDRARAIAHALAETRAGDVVVIAGKGHERVQIIGDERVPFDDRDAVREAIGR